MGGGDSDTVRCPPCGQIHRHLPVVIFFRHCAVLRPYEVPSKKCLVIREKKSRANVVLPLLILKGFSSKKTIGFLFHDTKRSTVCPEIFQVFFTFSNNQKIRHTKQRARRKILTNRLERFENARNERASFVGCSEKKLVGVGDGVFSVF